MKYSEEEIEEYTKYCLNCKTKPCMSGCPLGNNIPEFILHTKNKEYLEAYKVLSQTTVMPYVCGRICPKSKQCQGKCIRGIKGKPVEIGKIESFIGDLAIKNNWHLDMKIPEKTNKKVAIIGSGPSGITCSISLAKRGYSVTIYEKQSTLGGLLRNGIPNFRLEKKYVDELLKQLDRFGVEIKTHENITGKKFKEIKEENDAVFLSFGANISRMKKMEGRKLPNVIGSYELLEKGNHPIYKDKNVIVLGGGNVALDAARTAKKLGAKEVTIIYRRPEEKMPAEKDEIEEAKQDGVKFIFEVDIKRVCETTIECIRTELVKDEEGKETPVNIEDSSFIIDADYLLVAIGSQLDKSIVDGSGLELDEKGYIKINENNMTNLDGIFAGGDCIGLDATVAWAARSGRDVADKIDEYLQR